MRFAVTRHHVPFRSSARVVHLTDVHVGPTTPRRFLGEVARRVRELEPDLVVMTGDYVNASTFYADRITELVLQLPQPCVAVLGNHDHWTDAERVTRALERGGARVLRNESMHVAGMTVVGVDDGRSGHADVERAFFRVREPEGAIVLSHFPNTADEIAKKHPRLVLSGHTHAGHFAIPRVTKALARLAGNPYLHGFHRVGPRTDLYVNAGLGHSLPGLRLGAKPEIAVFDSVPE
jgi:predicted MPP superfamily phosphohydrolase